MKSFYNSLLLLLVIFIIFSYQENNAGTRYKDIVFPSVTITKDIRFGTSKAIDGSDYSLLLDIYRPENDTIALRPLIIFIHGGSLISGARTEGSSYCTDFAKRGYVSASIEYRLGIESPKNVTTILEALLRGVQDTKAAVRYFRSKAAEYGIDTSKIFLQGSSAGSMIAVHYAYWDQDEIPIEVNQSKWGNLEGTSGNTGFSSEIKGIINYCGAILNPEWINPGEVPVANFHGLLDPVVPPDDGVSTDFGIRMFGGVSISRAASESGIYNQGAFFPNMSHGGNEDSLRVFGSNFIYSLLMLSSGTSQDFSSPALCVKSARVFRYENFQFTANAVDKNSNTIILPHSMVQYSCDSKIGSINTSGVFIPSDKCDSGYVYAKLNNSTAQSFVKTYDLKYFIIKPQSTVTDTASPVQIIIDTYDADYNKHDLALTKFKLKSTVLGVGTIDSTGLFKAIRNGSTQIIAWCSGFTDTCLIKVESANGIVRFDELENLEGWTFTGENLDSLNVTLAESEKSQGSFSFKIDYKFTYNSQRPICSVKLSKDLIVYGMPDSVYLDVKSDGRKHKLFYRFRDANGGEWGASGKRYLNDSLAFALINAPMTGLAQFSGLWDLNYPLTMNRIEIQVVGNTVNGSINSGTIYIDNLRFKYPGETVENPPDDFFVEQNYPNPFNNSTVIEFNLSSPEKVKLKVYDILGNELATLLDKDLNPGYYSIPFNGQALASGIYIYRIETGKHTDIRKMILLK